MPLPANTTTVVVLGTFNTPEGNPSTGTITFTPSAWLLNSGANIAIPNSAVSKSLGTAGDFSVTLPITDDADLSPNPFVYSVSEVIDGVSQSYNISIPGTVASGGTVYLADLAPVAAAGPEYYSLASSLAIGTVTTLAAGSAATATITGLAPSQTLDLGIPTGPAGSAATVTVGTIGAVAYPGPGTVTNSGSSSAAVLDFTLVTGQQGATGATGPQGAAGSAASVTVGTVGAVAYPGPGTVTNSGSSSAAVLDFILVTGQQGATGPQGPAGPAGTFPNGSIIGEIKYWNGSSWASLPPGGHGQMMYACNGVPTWGFGGCPPLITTSTATSITATGATTGGVVAADGGASVTARGVAYGLSSAPTTSGTITNNGTGTGSFSSTLTGLTSFSTYYVRAYATNSVGTSYGNEINFTTLFECGLSMMTDVEGNTYNTVQIGTQCWSQSNLKVSKYRNGDNIPTGLSNSQWGSASSGAYAIYDNNTSNNTLYGKLYNGYAANDSRGLCPTGWHVPSDTEWASLITFLGGSSVAGGKMKSTTGWNSPNTGATNSSGFTGLPGGGRLGGGVYGDLGNVGHWWSTTIIGSAGWAWYRSLNTSFNSVANNANPQAYGYAVRCLRD